MPLDFIKAFHGTDPNDLEEQVNDYIDEYDPKYTISIIHFTLERIPVNSSADNPGLRMWVAFREEKEEK